jgi:hypothetical protein
MGRSKGSQSTGDFNEAERLAVTFPPASLHLRPHGVERFFASASTLRMPLSLSIFVIMPRPRNAAKCARNGRIWRR